jgi:hypothetical protein
MLQESELTEKQLVYGIGYHMLGEYDIVNIQRLMRIDPYFVESVGVMNPGIFSG